MARYRHPIPGLLSSTIVTTSTTPRRSCYIHWPIMRERITFVQKQGNSIEPTTLKIKGGVLNGPEIQAAREDRLTIAVDELPTDLQALLGTAHELHIRYVSSQPYEAITPLLARLPPGFHLFYTPAREAEATSSALCLTLNKVFGNVQCETPQVSLFHFPCLGK